MADCEVERTTAQIEAVGSNGVLYTFVANGEVVVFDGFMRMYADVAKPRKSRDDDDEESLSRMPFTVTLPRLSAGMPLSRGAVHATQRFTQHPARYNEATLVRKLEELGIGRPSTYAPTISTIQQREYVQRVDKPAVETPTIELSLGKEKISEKVRMLKMGAERGRLVPTDIGVVVNDFLIQYFPEIMDYNFTADVEKLFDEVAEGGREWQDMMVDFYGKFEPQVLSTMDSHEQHRAGERVLGTDPATGLPVSVKIGRYGPVVQIGSATDEEKPRFARLADGQSIETLTLAEALELFSLPRTLGQYDGADVVIGTGRFGPYVLYQKKFVSIPKDTDPMQISLADAVELINRKRIEESQRLLRTFDDDPDMQVLNGPYGPYISYNGKNYRLPKELQDHIPELTLTECKLAIKNQPERTVRRKGRK